MVESTALEMRRTRKGTVGSNPTLSARLRSVGASASEGTLWVQPADVGPRSAVVGEVEASA